MMKMTFTSILVVVVVFSTLFGSVLASCKFSPVLVYSVSETAPNVTYIFNFTKDAGDAVTFTVKQNTLSNEALQTLINSFRLREKDNTTIIFETTKTLDLEVYWIEYKADITTTVVTITCAGSGTEVTIAVQPVNEFAPVFQHGPFNLTLNESTPVGTTVFTLKDKIDDPDHGEQPNFVFAINPYTISSLDGSEFFNIPTSTRGDIAVAKVLDYDNPSIKKSLTLNLSVTDQGGLKGTTLLIVKIEDVDDQKPYFEFPNCASPCPIPPFLAITELDTKGPLEIIPIPIKGYDNDTLGTKLLYNITSGNELGMFSMDPNTGSVTQIKSVNEVRSPAAEFRLVVQIMVGFLVPVTVISTLFATDTTILSFTKEAGDTVSFSVLKPNLTAAALKALQESLRFVEENTTVHLQATKTLDLDVFWLDYQADITYTVVTITCNGVQSFSEKITIVVQPVNEYPPVFLQGPYNLSLPESTSLKTTVFSLRDKVSDYDHDELSFFVFYIAPYIITDLDGRTFFTIPTSTKGDIVVARALDYDNPAIRNVMTLNLSVSDSGGLRSFTTLEVKILDVDDQSPYFEFPNCAKPCPVPPFMAITELDYKGPLQIIPVPLQGLDNDTLGTKLQYVLDSGNDNGMFSMDVNTGVVTQIRSVNEARSSNSEFRLVIEVRKNISIDLHSLAILTVKVRERLMSTDIDFPPPTPTSKSTEKQGTSSGLVILTAVLGTLFACVIAVVIVVVIIYWKTKNLKVVKKNSFGY